MPKNLNLIGKRSGKLVVVKKLKKQSKHDGSYFWKCKCDCGGITKVRTGDITTKSIKSCKKGCSKLLPDKEAAFRDVLGCYRRNKNGFYLTEQQFLDLIIKPCYYCSKKSSNVAFKRKKSFKYNGLDRIDNSKGYQLDNVITSCKDCNFLRRNVYTVEETKVMVNALKRYRKQHEIFKLDN